MLGIVLYVHGQSEEEERENMKNIQSILAVLVVLAAASAWATDGMNMEGYGPVALGVGGASYAYDNGNAAVINNPATLSLGSGYTSRLDVALGFLGPDVSVKVPGAPRAESSGDAYFMPALGWSERSGALTYGFGIFAQGGMGTEFAEDSFLALNSGEGVYSELSVGRFIAPLSYQVTEKLAIGGTLDFVWAGLDLQMAIPGSQIAGLARGGTLALPAFGGTDYARLDFADNSPFTGEAQGYGYGGKIGFVYRLHKKVSLGAVYQSETALSDLETDDGRLSYGSSATGVRAGAINGDVTVKDFQWPETYGAGIAVQATDRLLLVADVKQINWSKVMEDFKVTFDSSAGSVDLVLPQNWDDQLVYALGAAFEVNPQWTLRAGYNITDNQIPDSLVNPLFPAIVEEHITAGFGFAPGGGHSVDVAVSYAPETSVTSGSGIEIDHSQLNGQVMYTYRY